jgi:hypothetical protein
MNVFLIETPHQLLNAIEARHFLGLRDSHLVVVLVEDYPQQAYTPLVRAEDWITVHYVPNEITPETVIHHTLKFHKSERIRSYFQTYKLLVLRKRLDVIARSFRKVRTVFLGNYNYGYMRHFANMLKPETVYLLDDGTATLIINKRRKEGRHLEDRYVGLRRFMLYFIDLLLGMKVKQFKNITFFTTYDLTTKAEDRVINHNYSYLRSIAGAGRPNNEIYFLGTTLIAEGLSKQHYIDYFRKVLQYFQGQKIVYIYHKGEPTERIAFIKENLGVQVLNFGIPIEYQLAIRQRPRVLASFCCSALENCRIIFGDELQIKSFYIDPDDCPLNPDFIRDIYAYYESKSGPAFEVVRI